MTSPVPLCKSINYSLAQEDVRTHLITLNMQPERMTPAEAAAFIKTDARRWSDVIRAAHVTAE